MSLNEQILNNHSEFLSTLRHRFLDETRVEALGKFVKLGFPTKKDEEYKYTNIKEIIEKDYNFFPKESHNITKEQLDELHFGEENFDWIVFVNGQLHKELSKISIENAEFLSFNYALNDENHKDVFDKYFNTIVAKDLAFTNLNQAYCKYGFFLKVPKNVVIEKPIHIFYLSQNQEENTFYNTRNLLIVEDGAKVEVIESHHNFDETYVFTNSVTEIFTYPNAKADWHKLQNDNDTSYLVDHTFAKQERDSLTTVNTFSFGGKIVRNNLDFIQNGSNINSFMNGITIIGKDQLVDHHTAVHHNQPNCESYQNYKGIFKDKSHGVFNGKVFVDKIAQKTNAYQQNNNVLLSEGATIDTKPQLEIFADDVKCSHGCTVGQLNEDALFYLRARGISKKEAQALLLFAFANDAMQNIDIEPLKEKISKLLTEKLEVNIEF
ncbi:Fe-S cluster assembly protein SufD [Chryseobacterium formosense]|uniref:Fe-S cluster assembly protein SufD n=1 Tax=Chryseobacterium formosense TaxID=236814 RepID=A0A085Z240_9FLAO|nr:Fe-S cluster assembly protein SufD [Chryseobacterium formosense]KFE98503.1 Fe-S cluster assembly protein SufD [Chryseobacterium formosense]SFT54426.1 Iron-regulated ABC transporter permease protein SufD [Chryseobacterium formosense]